MKLQLGISGEKLSDLSGAIVEVLTHHRVYTLYSSTPTADLSTHWTYIECFSVVSNVHWLLFCSGSVSFALNNIKYGEKSACAIWQLQSKQKGTKKYITHHQ